MKKVDSGANILICGSQKFDDQAFVFGALGTLYEQSNGNIRKIFTSKYSGACEFAREWVNFMNSKLPAEKQIKIDDYKFDMILEEKNQSFYEDAEIPAFAVANNPFFKKGQEELSSRGVSFVVCFPNKEGKLGASTQNIHRFAELGGIPVIDCSAMLAMIHQFREEKAQEEEVKVDQTSGSKLGFNNRHPGKR
jgi:hypothetical protein